MGRLAGSFRSGNRNRHGADRGESAHWNHDLRKETTMNFWKRSIRTLFPAHRDPARSRRAPSRSCRLQLEDLEGRALLSTAVVYEYLWEQARHVVVQVQNNGAVLSYKDTVITANPPPTFQVNEFSPVGEIDVLNTSADVPIQINGHNPNTVIVGDNDSGFSNYTAQGILAPVTIDNPSSSSVIDINDMADDSTRTVTLCNRVAPGWGEVLGVAPAPIVYNYAQTTSMNLVTGGAAWATNAVKTVDVLATGVPTYITTYGFNTVNVGNAGSVQDIHGLLDVSASVSEPANTININDGADGSPRTVTLSTYPWGGLGEVSGLATAPIFYNYAQTDSIHLTTNTGGVTVDVLATGVPTYIGTPDTGDIPGFDTVNIGDGTVQDIAAPLYISNRPSYTAVNINDSEDTGERDPTLGTFTGPDGRAWGSIAGLSPAAINFAWEDMAPLPPNQVVNVLAPANFIWTVNPDANQSVVKVLVLLDGGIDLNF
jgi:hypothetical protein